MHLAHLLLADWTAPRAERERATRAGGDAIEAQTPVLAAPTGQAGGQSRHFHHQQMLRAGEGTFSSASRRSGAVRQSTVPTCSRRKGLMAPWLPDDARRSYDKGSHVRPTVMQLVASVGKAVVMQYLVVELLAELLTAISALKTQGEGGPAAPQRRRTNSLRTRPHETSSCAR